MFKTLSTILYFVAKYADIINKIKRKIAKLSVAYALFIIGFLLSIEGLILWAHKITGISLDALLISTGLLILLVAYILSK